VQPGARGRVQRIERATDNPSRDYRKYRRRSGKYD
jgi:hypothetical protein